MYEPRDNKPTVYEPQINDYVEWTTQLGHVHEGWIYFKADQCIQKRGWPKQIRYITIEVGLKEKPDYKEDNPHKYVHILLCCYEHQWKELKFVKKRKDRYER
mgnify:CR=1 FL=1